MAGKGEIDTYRHDHQNALNCPRPPPEMHKNSYTDRKENAVREEFYKNRKTEIRKTSKCPDERAQEHV